MRMSCCDGMGQEGNPSKQAAVTSDPGAHELPDPPQFGPWVDHGDRFGGKGGPRGIGTQLATLWEGARGLRKGRGPDAGGGDVLHDEGAVGGVLQELRPVQTLLPDG